MPEQAFELIEPPKNALTELPLMPGTAAWTKMMQGLSKDWVGNGVTPPVVTHFADPQFSDEARVAKFQGICLISLIVDANGFPQNLRILKPLGKGSRCRGDSSGETISLQAGLEGRQDAGTGHDHG